MVRSARKYDKRIELFQAQHVPNGFGGNTVTFESVGFSFCNITTLNAQRATDLGLTENNLSIQIELRLRNDVDYSNKNQYFKYKGNDYNIISIEPLDLDGIYAKIIAATNGQPKTFNPIIILQTFDNTFDNTFA